MQGTGHSGPVPVVEVLEATTGFEPVMEVLQTSALPLGHVAVLVPRRGFEPLRPKARPPQDRVSTYSTTSAGGALSKRVVVSLSRLEMA
jgi:hypothetical protein